MLEDLGKVLTNVGLAGVGLAAMAVEQAEKAGKVLAERGAVVLEEGRRHGVQIQEKYQQDAQRRKDEQLDRQLSQLDAQQREALRRRLDELDQLEEQAAQDLEESQETSEDDPEE